MSAATVELYEINRHDFRLYFPVSPARVLTMTSGLFQTGLGGLVTPTS